MNENSIFSRRILDEIKKSGKSVNCIERELGYPRNALQNYKKRGKPSGQRLVDLSRYFYVTPEYLIGAEEQKSPRSLSELFESLDKEEKLKVYQLSQVWAYHQLIRCDQTWNTALLKSFTSEGL